MFDSFLPAVLLNGMLNFGQFIPTHRDFPYEQFFGKGFDELSDASREYAKKLNIFDKAMKKMGLLKDIVWCSL